jgi:hypothetical protein
VVYAANGSTTENVDLAVVVVGETPYAEGAGDSSKPQLSAADLSVIANVQQLGIPYVILLISGRPLILDNVINDAGAFVACWLPGTEATGITDILFGDYDFTGKLSHTWPSTISQEPINWGDATYLPLFPYGFGLNYTQNGVPSINDVVFSIFPNPTHDILMVNADIQGSIQIYNSSGELMLEEEKNAGSYRVDIRDLSPGVYFLYFTTRNGTGWQRFVKI